MRKIAYTTVLLCLFSCTENKEPVEIKNGNLSIAWTDSGAGDTALVFVHGWCINKEYWKAQQEYFSKKYRVITLDLAGHGESGHERGEWTVEQYAGDVMAVINGLQLEKVVLIGHSMGGVIILETAIRIPEKIIGFVGIDNFKSIVSSYSPQEQKSIDAFMQGLRSNFDTVAASYTKQVLFPPAYADTVSVNRVTRDIQKMDSSIAIKTLESVMSYSLKRGEYLSKLKIPVNLLVSYDSAMKKDAIAKYCPAGLRVFEMVGTGHYPMIERPDEFNSKLDSILHKL